MRTAIIFLFLTSTVLAELPNAEIHRLAAYLAYVTSSVDAGGDGGGNTPDKPTGGACQECNGVGKVGDGVVMFTCGACGGTGRNQSSRPPVEPDEAIAVEDEKAPAKEEPPAVPATPPKQAEQAKVAPPSGKAVVVPSGGASWNWQGQNNVSASTKRSHLISEHGMSKSQVDRMSDQEMTALHNLLHNEEVRRSAPKSSKSSSSCPSGNCPTSSSSSSRSRYRLFRR
jgi:pyruvate/2-oxoglutarate dehydrogenase complex dihydrolipoamide acyltransferase (E2) component